MEEKREELGTRQKACGDRMERDNKNPDLPSTNPSTTSALGLPSSPTYDHHLSIPSEFQSHALPSHVKYKNCRDVNIRVLLYNKAPMKYHMCPSTLFCYPWGNHGCDREIKPHGFERVRLLTFPLSEFWDIQTTVQESKAVSTIHAEVSLVCTGSGRTESKDSQEQLGCPVSQTLKSYQPQAYCRGLHPRISFLLMG